jgi:hypothetical protein
MRPAVLAVFGLVVLVASGIWAADPFATPPAAGTYGEADIVIVVGERPGLLALTGPRLGLLLGVGLILLALGWQLARRRRRTYDHVDA